MSGTRRTLHFRALSPYHSSPMLLFSGVHQFFFVSFRLDINLFSDRETAHARERGVKFSGARPRTDHLGESGEPSEACLTDHGASEFAHIRPRTRLHLLLLLTLACQDV
jgi:hypothetical protein